MPHPRSVIQKVSLGAVIALFALSAQQPTCQRCQATYIPVSELNAYTAKAVKYNLIDQQVRSVDIGKVQVGIGMVTRGKLLANTKRSGAVAEHEHVTNRPGSGPSRKEAGG
jgi:hypothetical protein